MKPSIKANTENKSIKRPNTTQSIKSRQVPFVNNVKPIVKVMNNDFSKINEGKKIKPIVEKIEGKLMNASKKSQKKECSSNVKNLGQKFMTLVKQSIESNCKEKKDIEDLHLIKEKVSVEKTKRIFLQTSKSSIGFTEQKSLVTNRSLLFTKKSVDNQNELVSEFLETVLKKREKIDKDRGLEIFGDSQTNEQKKNLPDEKKIMEVSKNERMLGKDEMFMKQNIVSYPVYSIGKQQERDGGRENKFAETFQPKYYTFRLAPSSLTSKNQIMSRPPGFWALLDNAIAVIWDLLKAGNKGNVGINPLQWTYELLKVMKYKNGTTPGIVEGFKEMIEDQLIENYAKMYEVDQINDSIAEDMKEQKRREISSISLFSGKRNKWVTTMSLMKSYSLREIVKRGRNSLRTPNEDDRLVIKSLTPNNKSTNAYGSQPNNLGGEDNTGEADKSSDPDIAYLERQGMNREEIKALLSKMKKSHAEKLQRELCSIKKIENYLTKVDDKFKPTMTYESAQIITSNEKLK